MTTPDELPPPAIPPTCVAQADPDFWSCDRCGQAWPFDSPTRPDCKQISFGRMKASILSQAERLEQSYRALVQLKKEGQRANPLPDLIAASELRGVLLFVEKVMGNEAILDLLNPARKERRT